MGFKYDIDLMVNVARLYFLEGLKQEEIAKRVNVSRSSISLILSEARENGIVEINVKDPLGDNIELSSIFKERFNLKKCYVVPSAVRDDRILLKLVVRKAIDVFNSLVKNEDLIGLTWGHTSYQFMSDYKSDGFHEGLRVIPLTGGTVLSSMKYQINDIVRLYADKISGDPVFIHAPAFPKTAVDCSLYMKSSELQAAVELWKRVNIALVSFGATPFKHEKSVVEHMHLSSGDRDVISRSAVGDIGARFYDINGSFIMSSVNERTIGIMPDDLKNIRTCIAAVSGQHKLSSIIGGLRTGIADVLVIDEPSARAVLGMLQGS